jgi:glutathione synthase
MVKGLSMKASANPAEVEYSHVPFSLFPTPYPVEHYEKAKELQSPLADMIAALVQKPHVIHDVLKYFQEQDPFLKKLVDMSKTYNSPSQKFKQNLHPLILRSDYMIDAPTNSLKLVEYNTIASSLSSHC